uniref:ryncolin-4-like n=1 Tax=Ciona intestinalis TaxID=7719 RepID=UPI000EF46B1D|nr:ryncolin-4-like [Ciona intestinalis]|eukprot:XP_026692410.1 ryncolin-4-like [Ciona intestinalis]
MKVFQRRTDGSQGFYLGWNKYVKGFGDKNNEFWFGLEKLHLLTRTGRYELRVDLRNCTNFAKYAVYSNFRVGSSPYYQLTSTGYSGNAGNALQFHNGRNFTTKDQDNDILERTNCPRPGCDNCAVKHKGAWWYSKCHSANLNSFYDPCVVQRPFHGVVSWNSFNGEKRGLRFSEMKFRPID